MPLTPAEVHNVAFKKPPIGKRGYDEEEVDAFLDIVEVELSRLIEENNELKARPTASGADARHPSRPPSTSVEPSWPPPARTTGACRHASASWRSALMLGEDGTQQQLVQVQQQLAQSEQQLAQTRQQLQQARGVAQQAQQQAAQAAHAAAAATRAAV